jgi:hypothetical protein
MLFGEIDLMWKKHLKRCQNGEFGFRPFYLAFSEVVHQEYILIWYTLDLDIEQEIF